MKRAVLLIGTILLLTVAIAVVSTRPQFLMGDLLSDISREDTVLELIDTDRNGVPSSAEIRKGLSAALRGIEAWKIGEPLTYDLDGSGSINKADRRVLVETLRSFLRSSCGNNTR